MADPGRVTILEQQLSAQYVLSRLNVHPGLQAREIVRQDRHPPDGWTVLDHLHRCSGDGYVESLSNLNVGP